jgi:hypothetical protein
LARDHFKFSKETLVATKRPRKMNILRQTIDAVTHGQALLGSLAEAREAAKEQTGFDGRLLFKIEIDDIEGSNLKYIDGVEIISQEDKGVFLVFSSESALETFEARLTSLASGETPTRKAMLEALHSFNIFTPEDRTGWALAQDAIPRIGEFSVDVELWPLSNQNEVDSLVVAFVEWCESNQINVLDRVVNDVIILFRLIDSR